MKQIQGGRVTETDERDTHSRGGGEEGREVGVRKRRKMKKRQIKEGRLKGTADDS